MKFPLLFRRERSKQAQLEAQEQMEKLLTDSMRTLSQLLTRAADHIEAQRLSRSGYAEQERFLERLDTPDGSRRSE
ncbi:MAG: hypothetical protein WBV82_03240 [Myxococcaceae bacterium]